MQIKDKCAQPSLGKVKFMVKCLQHTSPVGHKLVFVITFFIEYAQ